MPTVAELSHLSVRIEGFVQGVGFRPFVLRLAKQFQQHGWIANCQSGVVLAIEGCTTLQQPFLDALQTQLPAIAEIKSWLVEPQPLAHYAGFQIRNSQFDGQPSVFVLPDLACCAACHHDTRNPASRFYRYPFTSCCHCGPRYSIMHQQPYDRSHTSMAMFALCADCQADYQNPDDRRFHAQTLACPACGPQLQLLQASGEKLAGSDTALEMAASLLRDGQIVAIKGIGGYQLWVDAGNQAAVLRLRVRKQRPYQPFALMVADLSAAQQLAVISPEEQAILKSNAAPIVLVPRRAGAALAEAVAAESTLLGVMLAYTPLHRLLLDAFGAAVVATSGNRHDEPICIDEAEALVRLAGIADYFLVHNRAIVRALDDSIVRLINGKPTVLRRARGHTPLPIRVNAGLPDLLAVGGQLKNTVAISRGRHIIVSQHLGDLHSAATQQQAQTVLADLQRFYQITPTQIRHDSHSGYSSSQFASTWGGPKQAVQHHYAHALACMAEHGLVAPVLAIVWDGSGLGDDGGLWGGEFLLIDADGYQRFAHLRTFPLPGGGKAIQEPRRAALGLLFEMHGALALAREGLPFTPQELALLSAALAKQLNCPRTSSAGRLFDAVASLLGVCQINQYEGQAAMALEAMATMPPPYPAAKQPYPYAIIDGRPLIVDWQPLLENLIADIGKQPATHIAARLHGTLADIMRAIAERAGQHTVVFSGGCMQNAYLVADAVQRLEKAGFSVYCHAQIPPNDGGLAVGQIMAAGR